MNSKRILLTVCIAACFALFGWLIAMMRADIQKEKRDTYAAWVKQTGNPNDLSLREFYLLNDLNKQNSGTTILFLPGMTR